MEVPSLDRLDGGAVVAVALLLVVAYVVVSDPVVQYAAWLAIFCIWMLWFVRFGVKWWRTLDY